MKKKRICALCKNNKFLIDSHIIPKFVVRYMKDTSATGYLRSTDNIDIRKQDLVKVPLLCQDCENLFSVWENRFKTEIFLPAMESQKKIFRHENWMLKFAVSISWRNLIYHYPKIEKNIPPELENYYQEAEQIWREFLLNKITNLKTYQQHFILLDLVSSCSFHFKSNNINRYFTRCIELGMMAYGRLIATYSKMAKILVIGIIYDRHKHHFKGTRITSGKSHVGRAIYKLPAELGHHISEHAAEVLKEARKISDIQQSKINSKLLEDPERVISSKSFEALEADRKLFGKLDDL